MDKLKCFEDDLLELVNNIKFKPVKTEFQNTLSKDCKRIRNEKDVIMKADKTSNLYCVPVEKYKKHVSDSITKDYKKCKTEKIDEINKEAAVIAKKLNIEDRVEILAKPSCYLTVKDHKDTFPGKIDCRLINPSK